MPRGGHANSGPAPDPNAIRRGRTGDSDWLTLPAEGRKKRAPAWPLERSATTNQTKAWRVLWKLPQATEWERLHMQRQVAAYVIAADEAVEPGATAGLKTAVLRMEAELGLSLVGMRALRWRVGPTAVPAPKQGNSEQSAVPDIRDRMAAGAR
jgi:hypothetical protein